MRILMMGTGPFAVPTLQMLLDSEHDVQALVTRPVPPAKGRRKSPPNPTRDLGERAGLPVHAPSDVNSDVALKELRAISPDLLVVCDFGQILSAEAIAVAPLGGINLHASLLPKYRGAAPINWALYHGESETGVTVIHMTTRLDGGPCLVRQRTPIDPNEDAIDLEQRLAVVGAEAVRTAIGELERWDRATPIGETQDPAQATRAPRLKKSDGSIDWNRTASQICNQVRAFKPWPGSYTTLSRDAGPAIRLILDNVSVVDSSSVSGRPGQVAVVESHRLIVATGEGLLSLDRVQPAGKRVMDIAEFLRGHSVQPSQIMGMHE